MSSDPLTAAMLERCPHPEKNRYLDEATAISQASNLPRMKRWIEKRSKKGLALHPYRCRCGFWHLSSRRPE